MVTSRKYSKLNIVVPVYNESENFPKLIKEIQEKIKIPYSLIVVYDFDEDTTVPVVKKFQKKYKNIALYKNHIGRGALNAIKSGFEYVKDGPILVIMADLSDDLNDVEKMYKLYLQGADVVCGSRYMKGGQQVGGRLLQRTLSRLAGLSIYHLRHFPTHDLTNNFKLYNKEFLDSITIESQGGFEVATEITVKAFCMNKTIKEVPTIWHDRETGESNFKLWAWLPSYLKWYFRAFSSRRP